MEVFARVVEAGNLTRAADNLGLANASVTTAIRNLETHLGVTLLHRSTRFMRPTEEGAAFYEQCCDILARVEEAERGVAASGASLQGTLRVEMPMAIGHLMICPALVDFAERHPQLNTVVSLTNNVDDLIHRSVDVAIRMDSVDDGDLVARWLFEDNHVVCAAPDFLSRHGTPRHPEELNPARCLAYVAAPVMTNRSPWMFERDGKEVLVEPAHPLAFNSSDALLQTACRGGGFVYVLRILADLYLRQGQLVSVLGDWQTKKQTFYAVYPKARFLSPKVRTFVEFLRTDVCGARPRTDSQTVAPLVAKRSA